METGQHTFERTMCHLKTPWRKFKNSYSQVKMRVNLQEPQGYNQDSPKSKDIIKCLHSQRERDFK